MARAGRATGAEGGIVRVLRGALLAALLAALAAAVAACGSGDGGRTDEGATRDVAADTTPEAVADVVADLPDVRSEAGEDVPVADPAVDGVPDEGGTDDATLPSDAGDAAGGDLADVPADVVEADVPPPAPWYQDLVAAGPTIRDRIGVSSHMHGGTGANAERDFEIARYVELGAVHVRNDFHWSSIQPAADQWNFEPVQGEVAAVTAAGGDLLAIVVYGVTWAEVDAGGTSSIPPELYGAYAGGLAAELCDRITRYEIWNEPNLKGFWSPEPDPVHYALFLQAAHDAIVQACPDATVVLGGQAATDSSLGWDFLKALGTAMPGVCDAFDVLAIHPYTFVQAWSPERDFRTEDGYAYPGQTAMTGYARDRLADWGCPDRPIWFTEMGWPSYEVSEADQGRWLARSLLLSARDGVDRYYWYTFWDGEPITTGSRPHENYFGLFGPPGPPPDQRRAKPAWTALLGVTKTLGEARFAADVSANLGLPDDVYALAFVQPDGAPALALWDGRDQPDDGPDGPGPGGPDTTYSLSLPLPPDAASVQLVGLDGVETARPGVLPGTLDLVLTPAVQYVLLVPAT